MQATSTVELRIEIMQAASTVEPKIEVTYPYIHAA
jgi:hypothetical protein